MGCFLGSGWFCILMVSVSVKAQQMSSTKDHKPECLGNIVRLHVAAVLGNVNSIVNDSKVIELTPNLAAQCGFRYKFDRMGNAMLFASLLNCLAQSKDDKTLNLATQLRLHGKLMPVDYTCSYTWASREILCDDVYMEASGRIPKGGSLLPYEGHWFRTFTSLEIPSRSEQKHKRSRLSQLSSFPLVSLRHMTLVSLFFIAGSVTFTPELITWYLPRHIDPLFSSDAFTMLELYMGIDGKRLDKQEMAARKYSVSLMEVHVILWHVWGSPRSGLKTNALDAKQKSNRGIANTSPENTRSNYFVQTDTPLDAVPEQALVFKLGTFNLDVELVNVTLSTGVLTVAECNARGFNVQEEMSEDNLSKSFSMAVPFMDPAVFHENRPEQGVTSFTLHLIYGLVVLPENMAFSHSASVNAILMNVVPHSISGVCDQENFYITVNYGNQAPLFEVMVGGWLLTAELAEQYVTEGESRITLTVPFSAPQTVFESIHASAVRSRLSVALLNPFTNVTMKDFTLGCTFHKRLTECFSNGTMTALAVKVESTPSLNPGQLTLTDRSCGPDYSDDRFAYFSFNVNSCGTTRKFIDDLILYENEISLPDKLKVKTASGLDDDYHLTVSCYYMINNTQSLAYHRKPCNNEPSAKTESQLLVVMRIATDASYKTFHQVEEYPVVRYLRQPLHIEVELTRSTDPEVELVLDHCWATLDKDRNSKPRWNLIIKGCEYPEDPYRVVFNTVVADSRVLYPSHFKRFEVHIAAFTGDVDELTDKIFVHCDVFICDPSSPVKGQCSGQCVNQNNSKRGMECLRLFS
uniref:ZP domain-containing protein n=1 Tax=Esox lucius TaxID=8010 RepID=A0A6Q2XVN5_ESOLU